MTSYSLDELREIAQTVRKEAVKNRSSLIKRKYDSDNPRTRLDGLCYTVSESMYHLTGGKKVWTPKQMKHEGVSHWFLVHKETGTVFDLTEEQFESSVPHSEARGRGFCTGQPSNRSSKLIKKVESKIEK
mgnify:CR=1 FL=1